MLIAQISDIRLEVPGDKQASLSYKRLIATLDHLVTLKPQPELLVLTGDLLQSPSADGYRLLKGILDRYPFQIAPLMGDHDRRYYFRKIFSADYEDRELIQYAVDLKHVTLLVVDTVAEGAMGGSFSEAQAAWLDGFLTEHSKRPVLIAQHHAPIFTGIDWLSAHEQQPWVERYRSIIARHSHVRKIITGHARRSLERPFAGASVVGAASVGLQAGLDLRVIDLAQCDGRPLEVAEPPGFALHFFDGEEIVTHHGVVGQYEIVTAFSEEAPSILNGVKPVR